MMVYQRKVWNFVGALESESARELATSRRERSSDEVRKQNFVIAGWRTVEIVVVIGRAKNLAVPFVLCKISKKIKAKQKREARDLSLFFTYFLFNHSYFHFTFHSPFAHHDEVLGIVSQLARRPCRHLVGLYGVVAAKGVDHNIFFFFLQTKEIFVFCLVTRSRWSFAIRSGTSQYDFRFCHGGDHPECSQSVGTQLPQEAGCCETASWRFFFFFFFFFFAICHS